MGGQSHFSSNLPMIYRIFFLIDNFTNGPTIKIFGIIQFPKNYLNIQYKDKGNLNDRFSCISGLTEEESTIFYFGKSHLRME